MHVRLRIAIVVMGVRGLMAATLLLPEIITVRRFALRRPMCSGGDSGAPYPAPTRTGQMIMAAGRLTAVLLTSFT